MAAAAHSSSAVSVVVGLTMLLKVGCRGLEKGRERERENHGESERGKMPRPVQKDILIRDA